MKTIYSSHGTITIDNQGFILRIEYDGGDDDAFDDIEQFDLNEYQLHYGYLDEEYDILDLGYWKKNGVYVDPVESFRVAVQIDQQSSTTEVTI